MLSRQVGVSYAPPAPSLSPDPLDDPANQNLLRSYSVSYDAGPGTVTVVGTFNGHPAAAQNWIPGLTLHCGQADLTVEWEEPGYSAATGAGSARLDGFEGSVEADGRVSGGNVTFTFSHAAFRNQHYECFDNDDDGDTYYFAGYSPAEKAAREPTYLTVGPFGTYSEDRLSLEDRPHRFGLWGSSMAESGHFKNIKWSSWSRNVAKGTGYGQALHGRVAKNGRTVFDLYRVRFKLSRARLCGDVYEFTRMKITSKYGSWNTKIPNAC